MKKFIVFKVLNFSDNVRPNILASKDNEYKINYLRQTKYVKWSNRNRTTLENWPSLTFKRERKREKESIGGFYRMVE